MAFSSNPATGIYQLTNTVRVAVNGTIAGMFTATGQMAANSIGLDLGNTDTILVRDAANTLAQRNGTNAQAFRIYNTYTDASNYERVAMFWSANDFYIQQQNAGTGAARTLNFGTANTTRWWISSAGHFFANADNTYDIGASGATRPRNLYLGGKATLGATSTGAASLNLPHGTAPSSPVDGDVWTTTAGLFVRINGSTVGPLS
jgi:hypothetical protein